MVVLDGGSVAVMDHHHRFGHFSSLAIMMNNIIGPGVTQLPRFFQDCGWVLTSTTVLVTGIGTAVAGVFLCEAVRLIRGNQDFKLRIEYSSVVRHYFTHRALRALFLVAIIVNLEVVLIMSIAQSTELVDSAIIHAGIISSPTLGASGTGAAGTFGFGAHGVRGQSCGLVVVPLRDAFTTICWDAQNSVYAHANSPIVMSIGFALVAIATVPLSLYDLDANILVQEIAFVMTLCIVYGCWILGISTLHVGKSRSGPASSPTEHLPAWPQRKGATQLLGTCFFNFNYVFFLPTWANERKPQVGINWGVWLSTAISVATFLAVGIWGALAYSFRGVDNDMLIHLAKDSLSAGIGPVTSLLFPLVVNLSGIPVLSILIRYNIEEGGGGALMPRGSSVFLAHVLPWILVVFFNTQRGMSLIINIPSLLFGALVNFFLPIALYKMAHRRRAGLKTARAVGSCVDERRLRSDASDAEDVHGPAKPQSAGPVSEETPLIDNGRTSWTSISESSSIQAQNGDSDAADVGVDTLSLLPAFLQRGSTSSILANVLLVFFAVGTLTSLIYAIYGIVSRPD